MFRLIENRQVLIYASLFNLLPYVVWLSFMKKCQASHEYVGGKGMVFEQTFSEYCGIFFFFWSLHPTLTNGVQYRNQQIILSCPKHSRRHLVHVGGSLMVGLSKASMEILDPHRPIYLTPCAITSQATEARRVIIVNTATTQLLDQ